MARSEEIRERLMDLANRGHFEAAIDAAREELRLDPEAGPLWKMLGLLLYRTGDSAAACEALEEASALVPLDHACQVALGVSYARAGQPKAARLIFLALAGDETVPDSALPAVAAGLGGLGEYAAALEICRELMRRDPDCHEAHFGAAFYLRKLGSGCGAIQPLIARAHELAPEVPLYRVTLGSLLERAGRRAEAYDLVRDVDPRAVGCRCCLKRMIDILLLAGDAPRVEAFQGRVAQMDGTDGENEIGPG
jgi:tetratricopeptide (TPR) repeat protein